MKRVKKALQDLVRAAAVAATLAFPSLASQGCRPHGEHILDTTADGIIDLEEKAYISDILTDHNPYDLEPEGTRIDSLDQIKGLINDEDFFIANEFYNHGHSPRRIGNDLKHYFAEDIEELGDIYEFRHSPWDLFTPGMPEGTIAFFYEGNNTVYSVKGATLPGRTDINRHEFGHYFIHGKKEIPAEINRILATYLASKLDKEYGSITLHYAVDSIPSRVFIDQENGKLVITERLDGEPVENSDETSNSLLYIAAYLTSVMNINKFEGDLFAAYNEIDKKPIDYLRREFFNVLEAHGGDMREVWADETEKMIKSKGLKATLLENHSKDEVEEIEKYLNFNRLFLLSMADWFDGFDVENTNADLDAHAAYFINSHLTSAASPFLRAMVIHHYTYNLSFRIEDILRGIDPNDIDLNKLKEARDQAKKMIDINLSYPCDGDYFSCPNKMKEVRSEHVGAYADVIGWTDYLHALDFPANPAEIVGLGHDYLTRFFGKGSYRFEDYFNGPGMYALTALPMIGEIAIKHATSLASTRPGREGLFYACSAEEMAKAMLEASCDNVEDDYAWAVCKSTIPDEGFATASATLETMAGSCEALFPVPKIGLP